jgi:hypothetical protein
MRAGMAHERASCQGVSTASYAMEDIDFVFVQLLFHLRKPKRIVRAICGARGGCASIHQWSSWPFTGELWRSSTVTRRRRQLGGILSNMGARRLL